MPGETARVGVPDLAAVPGLPAAPPAAPPGGEPPTRGWTDPDD